MYGGVYASNDASDRELEQRDQLRDQRLLHTRRLTRSLPLHVCTTSIYTFRTFKRR